MGTTLVMDKSLLRCWLSQLGEVQQHSANHSLQDISASVVKEVVIQMEQGGLGGVAAKKPKEKKSPQEETYTQQI